MDDLFRNLRNCPGVGSSVGRFHSFSHSAAVTRHVLSVLCRMQRNLTLTAETDRASRSRTYTRLVLRLLKRCRFRFKDRPRFQSRRSRPLGIAVCILNISRSSAPKRARVRTGSAPVRHRRCDKAEHKIFANREASLLPLSVRVSGICQRERASFTVNQFPKRMPNFFDPLTRRIPAVGSGHPRFLLRGLRGAQTEISLAVTAYNLKRMLNILGGRKLPCRPPDPAPTDDDVNSPPPNKKAILRYLRHALVSFIALVS